jgi:signal transduction histidine kinase
VTPRNRLVRQLLSSQHQRVRASTDRLFSALMTVQWLGAIVVAWVVSPETWEGATSRVHPHVWAAVVLGLLFTAFPVFLALTRPGETLTRHAVAIGQLLMSGLLIHVTGGRIETHFHIFGSLAFLAFYRDRNVLVSASLVVAFDHLVRGAFWPESIYGLAGSPQWRWLEHTFWVLFEDGFLFVSIGQSLRQMQRIAAREADLTDANAELEVNLELLKSTQAQLIFSDRLATLGQVCAGVAHEINNPLSYVSSSLNFALEELKAWPAPERLGQLLPDVLSALEDARQGTERVRNIVKDLKSSSRRDDEARGPVDLHLVLASALNIGSHEISSRAQLSKDLGPVPVVRADSGRLIQVFLNLLVNAGQACEGEARHNKVHVASRTDANGWAVVEVSDSGPGMSDQVQAMLFTPFFTTKPSGVGTGLGLSICQAIIGGLNGAISVESVLGRGSTFRVSIPPAR